MFRRALATQWRATAIRVHAIVPGPMAGAEDMARPAASPEVEATITAAIPLRRLGGRGGAADRAAHLRRGNARYVTGAILDCDGGGVLGDASADAAASPRRTCT